MAEADAGVKSADILLVEDNPGDVRLIKELLRDVTGGASTGGGNRSIDGASASGGEQATGATSGGERTTGGEQAALQSGTRGEGADASSHGVRHADRLEDGLAALERESFDVVLLDLGLPDSTGIETLEAVREQTRKAPIVVLTGLQDETVGDQAVQRGAQEYLVKDELTPMLLSRSIRHAIERKKFERTQTALHDASRDVIQAESKREVSRLVLDAAVEVLDHSGILIYLFADDANELRVAATTEYVEGISGHMTSFGPGDDADPWEAFITDDTVTFDGAETAADGYRDQAPFESGICIPLGDHGVMTIVSEDGGGFDQQTHQLADHLAATAEAALGRVEREQSLREHERELTEQNRRLEELNRMNEIIREIDQVLVQATTRDTIEQAVCDLLTQDERFVFAWIGEATDGEMRPRTWGGDGRGYLDSVSLATDDDDGVPSVTASTTETAEVVTNVATDLRDAPWRKAALARDLQSVIAIPLTYNEMSYGVLTAYANDPGAVDDRSTEVFEELGETIANAMNSVETRQALLTDTVVELELAVEEPDDALGRLSCAADCEIEYGGIVPQENNRTRLFFDAKGVPAADVAAAAENIASITRIDQIGDDDGDQSRFEATVGGATIPSTLVECGAVARSLTITDAEMTAVVELPDTTDVRTFIGRFEETYPDTELVARRDKERDDRSKQAFETALTSELTDRQLETLQAAYLGGYFEWPRDRTGEEVAESLGITQPTFNGHLRAAERKLCRLLFDDPSSSAR